MEIIAWEVRRFIRRTIQVYGMVGVYYGKSVGEIGSNWIKFLPRRNVCKVMLLRAVRKSLEEE